MTTDAWPVELASTLQPGANELRLFRFGTIESSRREALIGAVWAVDGRTVGDWVASGRTEIEVDSATRVSATVPVGIYTVSTVDGEPVDVVVSAGETTRLP